MSRYCRPRRAAGARGLEDDQQDHLCPEVGLPQGGHFSEVRAARDALRSPRELGGQRRIARAVRGDGEVGRSETATHDRLLSRESPPLGGERKVEKKNQAIRGSRGG